MFDINRAYNFMIKFPKLVAYGNPITKVCPTKVCWLPNGLRDKHIGDNQSFPALHSSGPAQCCEAFQAEVSLFPVPAHRQFQSAEIEQHAVYRIRACAVACGFLCVRSKTGMSL